MSLLCYVKYFSVPLPDTNIVNLLGRKEITLLTIAVGFVSVFFIGRKTPLFVRKELKLCSLVHFALASKKFCHELHEFAAVGISRIRLSDHCCLVVKARNKFTASLLNEQHQAQGYRLLYLLKFLRINFFAFYLVFFFQSFSNFDINAIG